MGIGALEFDDLTVENYHAAMYANTHVHDKEEH